MGMETVQFCLKLIVSWKEECAILFYHSISFTNIKIPIWGLQGESKNFWKNVMFWQKQSASRLLALVFALRWIEGLQGDL
jgi:hypothetical protein